MKWRLLIGSWILFTFFNQSEASKFEMEASDWLLDFCLHFFDFRVAMRQQGDLIRSVYPKLILEGGNAFNEATGQLQPLSSAVLKKPPLARAVHLTLGKCK